MSKRNSHNQLSTRPDAYGLCNHLTAVVILAFIILNLVFWICPLLVLVIFKWLLPFSGVHNAIYRVMSRIYHAAVRCDDWVLFRVLNVRLDVEGIIDTKPGEFYLVISNHQSWSDILILQHLLNRQAAVMKFLVKRELIYVPLVGLICWAYDYPFLNRRYSASKKSAYNEPNRDTEALNRSLKRFMRSKAAIVNFVEGTRSTPTKTLEQKSPYQHLLKPKVGGLAAIFSTLGRHLIAVVNITIVYDSHKPTFWRFIGGRIRRVKIRAKYINGY